MNEQGKKYYWQDIVTKTVTATNINRKPSRLHKRITKTAYESALRLKTGTEKAEIGRNKTGKA